MASTVAWLNFDAEQQRRTELMMAAFAEQGTVDELGLGNIRDLIARALHPGLTVLQTRARYLVFLPHIYQSIQGSTVEQLRTSGHKGEGQLVADLNEFYRQHSEQDDRGIIGRNRGEAAKQPASVAYWGLLRDLGILRMPSSSISDYCAALLSSRQGQAVASGFHDEDLAPQTSPAFWSEFPAPDAASSGFNLSRAEAEWLQDRFLKSGTKYANEHLPLWAHLLRPEQTTWVPEVMRPWDHPEVDQFPTHTREAMLLGRDLDQAIHGARILYNYLCSAGQPADHPKRDEWVSEYETAMGEWLEEVADGLPAITRMDELSQWAQVQLSERGSSLARHRAAVSMRFVKSWHQMASNSDDLLSDPHAAELLKKRESAVKPGRARLANKDRLRDWQGGAGYGRFVYNWGVANRILTDIHSALGTQIIEGADA